MARRRKPQDAPLRDANDGGAILLSGAGAIGPVGPNGERAGVTLEVEQDLVVLVDSRALVDVARRAVLDASRDQILEGRRPDGGPQRPLSQARRAEPGRVSDKRGVRTGVFADELVATPIVGDEGAAASDIVPPPERLVFARAEAKRGVTYLALGPAHAAAAQRAIDEAIDAIFEGRRVEAEDGAPTAREEADS